MMVTKVKSLILQGVEGKLIEIEANLYKGLNKFIIVGLPDRSINEAKDRITSALLSSDIPYPYGQLVVNLSPAFLEKSGTSLDLPICLAVLMAGSVKLKKPQVDLDKTVVIGELGLDGNIKKTKSAPAFVVAAKSLGFKNVILPKENFIETQFISGIRQFPVSTLEELLEVIISGKSKQSSQLLISTTKSKSLVNEEVKLLVSREFELRILGIAAAGRHNLLFDGPPGSGKSTLLKNFNVLLPKLAEQQALEVFKLHSLVEECDFESCKYPPLRSPHHSITDAALIGGGTTPVPGEISMAHHGVLFLDEISEFSRYALESLRQPLVDRKISIARANYKAQFPADFQLIATRNPCPCGWKGDRYHDCICKRVSSDAYQNKLSGPLLDRIDIKHRVENVTTYKNIKDMTPAECKLRLDSVSVQIKVAREMQKNRYEKLGLVREGVTLNSQYNNPLSIRQLGISGEAHSLIKDMYNDHKLTLRSTFKIAKLARTIADFDGKEEIDGDSVYEAYGLNSY